MKYQVRYYTLTVAAGSWIRQNIIPVIPPKANRKESREYDKYFYKKRHLIECFIDKIKQFRRVFSRFDKWAKNYMNFVRFASALICLRWSVNRNYNYFAVCLTTHRVLVTFLLNEKGIYISYTMIEPLNP